MVPAFFLSWLDRLDLAVSELRARPALGLSLIGLCLSLGLALGWSAQRLALSLLSSAASASTCFWLFATLSAGSYFFHASRLALRRWLDSATLPDRLSARRRHRDRLALAARCSAPRSPFSRRPRL